MRTRGACVEAAAPLDAFLATILKRTNRSRRGTGQLERPVCSQHHFWQQEVLGAFGQVHVEGQAGWGAQSSDSGGGGGKDRRQGCPHTRQRLLGG